MLEKAIPEIALLIKPHSGILSKPLVIVLIARFQVTNQLAGSADGDESLNDSLGDYIQAMFTDCLGCLIEEITDEKLVTEVGIVS